MTEFQLPADIESELKRVRIERDRRECLSLATFAQRSWHVLEPNVALTWGKPLDVMCEMLEEIFHNPGFQPRLLANVSPGSMKSMLWSVIFPAWVWTIDPTKSFTGVAHEQGLAIRDARKMRLLVESEWYQERWPLAMASDANAKTYFENEKRGFRQAVPFRSMTGRRSDFVIVDDPHSAEDANSPAYREETKRIFRETLPTRVNNDHSAILIIMQRLHEDDISGIILSHPNKFGYDTLILPMRFEAEKADPRDWRTEPGELFFPERFSEESVAALEESLGSYGTASQLQQRPVPREGGMFKHSWFDGKYLDTAPQGTRWKRWWDLAATKDKNAARTAGVLLGRTPDGRYIIGGSATCQEEPFRRNEFIRAQCEADVAQYGHGVEFYIPVDPGAGGKETAMSLVQFLDGFNVRSRKEVGDKESRAEPFSAACEGGNVYLLSGDWNKAFLEELCLAKDSEIVTLRGLIPIHSVKVGDKVMTREGWRTVTVSSMTKRDAELWEITMTNGRTLRATGTHPIFSGQSFKRVDQLQVNDELLRFTGEYPSITMPNLENITSAEQSEEDTSNFTGSCGKMRLGLFQKGITYITRMMTQHTTKLATSNAYRPRNMFEGTRCGNQKENKLSNGASYVEGVTPLHKLEDHTLVRKVVPTSGSLIKATSTFIRDIALTVMKNSYRHIPRRGFVPSGVQNSEQLERMQCNQKNVISAEQVLNRRTKQSDFVADVAVSSIRIIPGKHEVYNLEVEGCHEFVANGILVHNCLFPGGKWKDQVDAVVNAHARFIAEPKKEYSFAGALVLDIQQ